MKINQNGDKNQWRQGDVFIERVTALPKTAKKSSTDVFPDRVVLAYGEVTGHSHQIKTPGKLGGKIIRHDNEDGSFFLTLPDAADVCHDEHDAAQLPAGIYRVRRQREYSPEEIRNVRD